MPAFEGPNGGSRHHTFGSYSSFAEAFFSHAKKTCIRLVACVMRHECTCLRMRMPNGGFRHPILSGIFSWDHVLCISCFTCTSCMENRARVMREHGACCMHVSAYCMHTRPPSGKVALPIDPHGSIFMTHAKNRMNFHAFRPDATSRPISALGAWHAVFGDWPPMTGGRGGRSRRPGDGEGP